jgi:hypothetical protein
MGLGASIALAPLAGTPWQAAAIFTVAMAGNGACNTLITADLLARIPRDLVPIGAGIATMGFSLGGVIANLLVGWSVDRTHGFVASALTIAVCVVVGTLAWILWRPGPFER